ncbi:MAG TPA: chromate efflux transporter [Acidimicrobiales bacterium]|nr:chromate efflux transporter [Acidimicrobiales bacterium]
MSDESTSSRASLATVAAEWSRLGVIGFGGPATHISLLRRLCVERRRWIDETEFQDAIAATNLLPGPASTQLAIFCAWRVAGLAGGVVGGMCFILPGLVLIVALAALVFAHGAPAAVAGAAAGAGAGTPAVALRAARDLMVPSRRRAGADRTARVRWVLYCVAGVAASVTAGVYLVAVIVGCGLIEMTVRSPSRASGHSAALALGAKVGVASLGALSWVAFKVGALSFGGGFVIVPLMQHDVVTTYHWMTGAHFLSAVALGQVTPGPVVLTVAAVGYAAAGLTGALVATAVAFAPSFLFVLGGAPRFHVARSSARAGAFLAGAGPCALGAIAGSAVTLGRALSHPWQAAVLGGVLVWLFAARRGVVSALLLAGVAGALIVGLG